MSELSPAAQAVAKAALYVSSCDPEEYPYQAQEIAAAVLRAAADKHGELEIPFSVINEWETIQGSCASFYAAAEWGYRQALNDQRSIADELEKNG